MAMLLEPIGKSTSKSPGWPICTTGQAEIANNRSGDVSLWPNADVSARRNRVCFLVKTRRPDGGTSRSASDPKQTS